MISKPDNLILEEIFGGMGSVEPMEEILRSTALATDGDGAQNPSHGEEIHPNCEIHVARMGMQVT